MRVKDTEAQILSAATRVFLERGLSGARMQEIADLAGINKALLHYYFRSKEKLYELVLETQIGQVFRGLLTALNQSGSFEEWLRSFVRYYLQTISGHPAISRLMIWELSANSGRIQKIMKRIIGDTDPSAVPIIELVTTSLISGGYDRVDPIQFLISLLSLCVYPIIAKPMILAILPEAGMDSVSFLVTREEYIYQLMLSGIKNEQFLRSQV